MRAARRPRHEELIIKVLEDRDDPITAGRITELITNRKGPSFYQVKGILRRLVGRGIVVRTQDGWKASEYRLRVENG